MNAGGKIIFNKKSAMLFLAFCLWIVPSYLYNVPIFKLFANAFGYFMVIVFLVDICNSLGRSSSVFWLIFVSIVIQAISTAMHNPGGLTVYVRQSLKSIAFYYFLDKLTREKGASRNINVLLHYFEMMIVINFVTLVLFPNGMYAAGVYSRNYWMGYDNTHIRWQIPALAISYIYSIVVNKKIEFRTVFLIVISLLSTLITRSATAIVAIVVFLLGVLYILLNKKNNHAKGINFFLPVVAAAVSIIGSILVIGGTIVGSQVRIVSKIANLLGKDAATLTGRSYIWISSLTSIKENLMWGVGFETADMTSMRLVNRTGYGTSPHNLPLEVLYCGGIVLGIVIVLIYVVLQFKLSKYKKLPVISVCGLWLIIISVMGFTEPQYGTQLRLAWIITGNIVYLCRENGMCDIAERNQMASKHLL